MVHKIRVRLVQTGPSIHIRSRYKGYFILYILYSMSVELSLCIPTMNRWNFLQVYIPKYLTNKYIKEIIIVDETGEDYSRITDVYKNEPKLKVYKNEKRLGPFLNKIECMKKATCEWICLMDSDNFADIDYFDTFFSYVNNTPVKDYIYCPSFSKQNFNYSCIKDIVISKHNLKTYRDSKDSTMVGISFNTGNYILNKECVNVIDMLLTTNDEVKEISKTCFSCDVIYMNCLFLKHDYKFIVIPNMNYEHVVHNGSIYLLTHKQCVEVTERVMKIFNEF